MRKCSVTDSQGWRGEEPKLGKQTRSKLNIETKPGEVAHKVQENFFEIKYKCDCPLQYEPWLLRAAESNLEHTAVPQTQTPFLPPLGAVVERGQRL